MLNPIYEVKLCAQYHARSEAICSLLYVELSFMLKAIQGVKLYPHCYTTMRLYAHCYK